MAFCPLLPMYTCDYYASRHLHVLVSKVTLSIAVKTVSKFIFLLLALDFQKWSIELALAVHMPGWLSNSMVGNWDVWNLDTSAKDMPAKTRPAGPRTWIISPRGLFIVC